ncbi:hypothetical protein ACIQVO_36660 [Streptomyces sp. NPDC101062]|uniref:hypothetical protein n=1 Tax=unclassified Streptomyces TaxID=2593676 RepID=UPI0037F6FBD6
MIMVLDKKSLELLDAGLWFARGTSRGIRAQETVEQWLTALSEKGTVQAFKRHDYLIGKSPVQAFDARWSPQDGVTVRARLQVETISMATISTWNLVAEATVPWVWSWPSPVTYFWPRSLDSTWDYPSAGGRPLRYRAANPVASPNDAAHAVQLAVDASTDIHVLTCEPDPRGVEAPELPVVRYLPTSLLGRVIERRVAAHVLPDVNQELQRLGLRVHLPAGGALIVPAGPNGPGIPSDTLVIPSAPLGQGRPQELVDAVTRHADEPRYGDSVVHRQVAVFREKWDLPTGPERIRDLETALEATENKLSAALTTQDRLNQELQDAHGRLAEAEREAAEHTHHQAQTREQLRSAREALNLSRTAYARLVAALTASDMGQALRESEQRRNAAEQDAEAAEDLLDEQTREIQWLRAQLAEAGRNTPAPVPEISVPATWEELVERATAELPMVVLGDVLETSRALRGHRAEPTWRRRAWEALRMLDAYAREKTEHGPDTIPHLTAYLQWTDAAVRLPRSRYSASESPTVLNSPRLRDERILTVPRDVHPSGKVLMVEHIRIGHGQPPAPRMYLYDNTPSDGRVYVGRIGEHLRNSLTN